MWLGPSPAASIFLTAMWVSPWKCGQSN
jgi:hypothetical protein